VILLVTLASTAFSAPAAPSDATWSVTARARRHALLALPASTTPTLRGRVVEPLLVESEPEVLGKAYLVEVRVRNLSRTARVLRWDVSREPFLRLRNGTEVRPIGHKVHGLAANTLAVKGILEVEVPPRATYTLYPVLMLERRSSASRIVIEGVGTAKLIR
jgi:hypothetical protein